MHYLVYVLWVYTSVLFGFCLIPMANRKQKKRASTAQSESTSINTGSKKKQRSEENVKEDSPMRDNVMSNDEHMEDKESIQDGGYSSDESMDDGIDWENIQLPPNFEQMDIDVEPRVYNDVEITIEQPRAVLKKSMWELAYQRNLREWIHNSHIVTLMAHFMLRNRWCSRTEMMILCSSTIPHHSKRIINATTSHKDLLSAIKDLLTWWKQYFKLTGKGLIRQPSSYIHQQMDDDRMGILLQEDQSTDANDCIEDFDQFMDVFLRKMGTRDTCAEMFVAILRSCGYDARLICSLQPISYNIPHQKKKEEEAFKVEKTEEESELLFNFRKPRVSYVDPNIQLRKRNEKPPVVWTEVYSCSAKKWICIDPIRNIIDNPSAMEPAAINRENRISLVLAFDGSNQVTDVTKRYTMNMNKALRLRDRPLSQREKDAGLQPWSEILLNSLTRKQIMGEREMLEIDDLNHQEINEKMPTTITGFKDHPMYVLERHLKKFEVIHPKNPVLGSIRGEKIYPRSCVREVKTADSYRRLGREIIEGEQPIKTVKANAVTIEKRRMKVQAKVEGHDLMVACYGEWQTRPYIAPPVINGKVPKNKFNNIDLFKPEMLPKGAVHIPIKGIWKIAKKLGIDYAEAVTDFEFIKMRAIPLVNGIVVAEEWESMLVELYEEEEGNQAIKRIEKTEKDIYARWRILIKGILITAKVDSEYMKPEYNHDRDNHKSTPRSDKGKNRGGGYLSDG
ncbi:hypothetical protein BDB01DRAFT_782487 [Pilobolus umbonatus]|nr:hypothetical protein BDB01DRAFT_782487 [Pilobolus umbonatus]